MPDFQDLYQDMVMDHNNRPRNFRVLEDASRQADGYNPLCGDRLTLYLRIEGDVISDIGFKGSGCAISKASSSLMTESVKGKSKSEAEKIFQAFHHMVTRAPGTDFDDEELGDLEILSGISQFPARVKCAILAWHTLRSALEGRQDPATTE